MKKLRSLAAALFLIAFVIGGNAIGFQEYASMSVGPTKIVWQPLVSNEGLSLSVAGPNNVYISREYEAGLSPSIGLADDAGNFLPDGQYSYEIRFTPVTGTVTRSGDEPYTAPSDMEPLVQSGSFRVDGGKFLVPSAAAEETGMKEQPMADSGLAIPMDQVTADDMIVQGSLCVGFDCVNGESFGFDTIRLKENNTRLKFEDTSVGSFPTNDWQLTANDSVSGGASYFSIDDITGGKTPFKVVAGAPSNSLYVNSSGNVGFGTSTPVVKLHVTRGDTPTIRLEQNSSSGFTAQTWDIAGNETNFFIRDVTNGSELPFRIQPNAPSNTLTLKAGGKVGIGTWSPDATLKVAGTIYPAEKVLRTGDFTSGGRGVAAFELKSTADMADGFGPSFEFWISDNSYTALSGIVTMEGVRDGSDTSGKWILRTANAGALGARLVVDKSGYVGIGTMSPAHLIHLSGGAYSDGLQWYPSSSREYKENIRELDAEEAVKTIKALNPVTYNYKADRGQNHVGFIAEDVPALVALKDRKALSPMDIVAVLTKAVQEQNKTIDDQQKAIEELKGELTALKGMVDRIGAANMVSGAYSQ